MMMMVYVGVSDDGVGDDGVHVDGVDDDDDDGGCGGGGCGVDDGVGFHIGCWWWLGDILS